MSHFPSDSYRLNAANRDPEEEALGWIVRLTSGEVTDADRIEFEVWSADPQNSMVFQRAQRLWSSLGPILADEEAKGWPAEAEPAHEMRAAWTHRRFGIRNWLVAASIALVASMSVQYARVWHYDHVTGTAVAPDLALADGSRVTLGPGTAFSSDFTHGARNVTIARGEVFFDVRHDPAHPFIVSTGNGGVRVLGTAFSVRKRDDGEVIVTVSRGRVQVMSGGQAQFLTPGRQITFGSKGLGPLHAVDASVAMAWMRGRLIMENKPLVEVLAELNRYRSGKIVLFNQEAGRRRVNAVIDLGHIDSWLAALASSQGLTLNAVGPLAILR